MLTVSPNFYILSTSEGCPICRSEAMYGQSHSCPGALSVQRRVRAEEGDPKTASLHPTMASTDNTLLSGCGGTMVPQRAGGGQGRRALNKGPHSQPPPLLPSVPPPPTLVCRTRGHRAPVLGISVPYLATSNGSFDCHLHWLSPLVCTLRI